MAAKKPGDLHVLFERSFNTRDADALVRLYEPTAILVANGGSVTGHNAIRKTLREFLTLHGIISLETAAIFESDGVALLHSHWTITPPSGAPLQGVSTEVARKQPDGTWLLAVDNTNTPPPKDAKAG